METKYTAVAKNGNESAKNSLGRGTGRRFNMAAMKREFAAREALRQAVPISKAVN